LISFYSGRPLNALFALDALWTNIPGVAFVPFGTANGTDVIPSGAIEYIAIAISHDDI
jgi:hypothetical protein